VSIRASLAHVFGDSSPKGRRIAIQGVGNVGGDLALTLHEDGAELVVCDVKGERTERVAEATGAKVVAPDAIYDEACDVFSPCALGLSVNRGTIERFKTRIICGSANNQLATPDMAEELRRRGILYAPDFIVNGGGIVNIADEFEDGGYNHARAFSRVERIGDRLAQVFRRAEAEGVTTEVAAERIAEDRIQAVAQQQRHFVPRR